MSEYKKRQKLLTNDVDFEKRMRPSAVLNVFQEIASAHAEQLGVGFDAMAEKGLFWVLSRIRYEALRCPHYEQEIVSKTWPLQTKGVFFERDYEIAGEAGELLVRASSVWCILDRETHSVIPAKNLSLLPEDLDYRTHRALTEKIGKLPQTSVENAKTVGRIIAPGDLDFNYHVNNTRYADFIFDCFELEYLASHEIKALQIHYLQEGQCGIELALTVAPFGIHSYLIDGKCDGKPVFAASIEFH